MVLTGLLDFAVAITITAGLDQTCDVLESLELDPNVQYVHVHSTCH